MEGGERIVSLSRHPTHLPLPCREPLFGLHLLKPCDQFRSRADRQWPKVLLSPISKRFGSCVMNVVGIHRVRQNGLRQEIPVVPAEATIICRSIVQHLEKLILRQALPQRKSKESTELLAPWWNPDRISSQRNESFLRFLHRTEPMYHGQR